MFAYFFPWICLEDNPRHRFPRYGEKAGFSPRRFILTAIEKNWREAVGVSRKRLEEVMKQRYERCRFCSPCHLSWSDEHVPEIALITRIRASRFPPAYLAPPTWTQDSCFLALSLFPAEVFNLSLSRLSSPIV